MRTIHRVLAIISVALMLYLGGTGTMMQILDLFTLARHAPQTDPTVASINEGRYGNGDMQVIGETDLRGAALPQGLDFAKAFDAALAAMHKQAPGAQPRFVEVRMVGGAPTGQVRIGKADIRAFDLNTGASVQPVSVANLALPHSLREDTKKLHRFWNRRDTPGVWYELGAGVILWVLIITGLTMYFQLLSARMRIGRNQWFWMSGGWWKALHRVISVAAAVFIMMVAFTGTWIGFESVWHTFASPRGPQPDNSAPLADDQVRQMAAATLADFRRLEPNTPIKVLRVRTYGAMKQGGVVTGGEETRQILFDTETGKVASLGEPGYPVSGFPFGTQVHENIKHFHSGDMFGVPTRLMNLTAGLSLLYLSISGIVMYVQMWLKRCKAGRRGLVWI